MAHLNQGILGFGMYYFTVKVLSKKSQAMRRRISNPRGFKVRRYDACMIDFCDYCLPSLGKSQVMRLVKWNRKK